MFELNTPRAPSDPERIEDTVWRDTAAPSILGLGVSRFVSPGGAWRLMIGRSCLLSADLGRAWQIFVRTLFVTCKSKKKHFQVVQCSSQKSVL